MNEGHQAVCGSNDWRQVVRDEIVPWALEGVDLGDVVEVGPGYGATTDVFAELVPQLTSVEIDPDLAAGLVARFAGVDHVEIVEGDATAMTFTDGRFSGATSFSMLHHVPTAEAQDAMFAEVRRVLRPGGVFVALDSLGSDALCEFHENDTYNPIDPATLDDRLTAAGFTTIEVASNQYGWKAVARC